MRSTLIALLFLAALTATLSPQAGRAQAYDIAWTPPINISNSPDYTSSDHFLLSDPYGVVHLFWAEKMMFDNPGEQPDTILYSNWDGRQWGKPVDLFFAPMSDGTPVTSFPLGVMDQNGRIHLIWMQQPNAPNYAVYYSSVEASRAGLAPAWKEPLILADDLTGSKFSIHIAYTPPQTLHVVYARVAMGEGISEQRAVSYMRSDDLGATWSKSSDIFKAPSLDTGVSDTRLLVVASEWVFLTWTLWDESGNGQTVYFMRSQDNGRTWEKPQRLATRQGDEYERDWTSLLWLGGERLAAFWEGGWRAYRYAMYSDDYGASWGEPIDTFPWLIGDNGYIEFAQDSLGTQHLFLAQRIREGHEDRGEGISLWHSVWEGGTRWSDPVQVSRDENALKNITNPKVVIVNGNQIVAAWYGSQIYEIYVTTGEINAAPALLPTPWAEIAPTPTLTAEIGAPAETPAALEATPVTAIKGTTGKGALDQATIIFLGVVPAALVVMLLGTVIYIKARRG